VSDDVQPGAAGDWKKWRGRRDSNSRPLSWQSRSFVELSDTDGADSPLLES